MATWVDSGTSGDFISGISWSLRVLASISWSSETRAAFLEKSTTNKTAVQWRCRCCSAGAAVPVPQCQCRSAIATVPVPQCQKHYMTNSFRISDQLIFFFIQSCQKNLVSKRFRQKKKFQTSKKWIKIFKIWTTKQKIVHLLLSLQASDNKCTDLPLEWTHSVYFVLDDGSRRKLETIKFFCHSN